MDIAKAADLRGEDDLAGIEKDDLAWWHTDEDEDEKGREGLGSTLEGWTTEDVLIDALTTRNVAWNAEDPEQTGRMRQIEEDMVFLQLVDDGAALEKIWSSLQGEAGFPEVTGLVVMENARWLDFTRQARAMVATLYSRVLGEAEEDDDAPER